MTKVRMQVVARRERVEQNEGGEWCELADVTGPYHYPAWVAEMTGGDEVVCARRGYQQA